MRANQEIVFLIALAASCSSIEPQSSPPGRGKSEIAFAVMCEQPWTDGCKGYPVLGEVDLPSDKIFVQTPVLICAIASASVALDHRGNPCLAFTLEHDAGDLFTALRTPTLGKRLLLLLTVEPRRWARSMSRYRP
ncbi:MAG: hypothetical protein IPK67_18395 [Planctomycetes bacterium]|nr:hypothetical protein [Planctomycetota bacterium]